MADVLNSYGVRRNNCLISFMVVGPKDISILISESLYCNSKERKWQIAVHCCELIQEALRPNLELCVDFIIFTVDIRKTHSLVEVETSINFIDEHYLISDCTCLINVAGISYNLLGFIHAKLRSILSKYNIHYMSENIFNPQSCHSLANRILNLAEASLGIASGVPVHLL
ncbi:uncharacterized protein [Prorops nasuta]|uniref:uncharacterized protein isoform X3 n=1 Tax=Prorops nasuta TaxID=863751 RepID=UPI0034CE1FEE